MEPQAIFQVVSASQLPRGHTKDYPVYRDSLIRYFRAEAVTHPHYWKVDSKDQSFGKKENAPDYVYVMNGKWNEENSRDSRLYRFTVLENHVQHLWNHLNKATSMAPTKFIKLWVETLPEREQEETVCREPDSGYPTDNFLLPEYALKVNSERKWECEKAANRKFSYVYLLMLTRNIYFVEEGWSVQVFIASECFYFALDEIKGPSDDARKRRKFFDAEQRENPVNIDMACDVFAFGLIIVELLGALDKREKDEVTRNIRSHTVMETLNTFRNFEPCNYDFGKLLEKIFVPRNRRIKITEVVQQMRTIAAKLQSR